MAQADKYAELAITADRYNPAGRYYSFIHSIFVCTFVCNNVKANFWEDALVNNLP